MKFIDKKEKGLLSDKELEQHMNFDKFISGYTPPVKGWFTASVKLYTVLASLTAALITTAIFYFDKAEPVANKKMAFVNPPVKQLEIAANSFFVNTEKDTTFVFSSGSFITVPKRAFEDIEGNSVEGNVELHYREFHDQIDILLSGIPMNYDSAGVRYQLESAGMFELTATKDGKPVQLRPGKTVIVNMISRNPNATDFNVYKLDTTERKWKYVSENTAANGTCISAFEDKVEASNDQLESELNNPVMPQKAKAGSENFSIDFNADEFPELAVFSGLKFEPVKGETRYKSSLASKVWENVLIERHANGIQYVVTFTSGNESHRFSVNPVVDEKDHAAAMKTFERQMSAYNAVKLKKGGAGDSLSRLNSKFRNMALSADQMNERFNDFVSNSYSDASKDMLAYRTFGLRALGTYNSDKPFEFFRMKNNMTSFDYQASFQSESGEPLELLNVYMIRRFVNSVYVVEEERFSRFPYNRNAVDAVVGITYDRKLVYIKGTDLKGVKTEGNALNFTMRAVPADVVKPEQLKSFLKI